MSRPAFRFAQILAGLAVALAAPGCDRPAHRSVTAPPPAAATAPAPAPEPPAFAPPPPPPEPVTLEASAPLVELAVEGHGAAVVSLPLGARGKRPVVIATHGNYDRPEWQCEVWREIVGDAAFVLCPRGAARPDSPSRDDIRFTYDNNQALEREIDAGLAALGARFPAYVDAAQPLYTGFSLGAIMGVSIAARAPGRFPRMVLIEGGHDKWTRATAVAFARGGGQRVLFVCSQGYCGPEARLAGQRIQGAGAAFRLARGPDVGHRYDGPTAAETRRALPWVLEGDARWTHPGRSSSQ
jgi:pimeloyl-ACP methyl ester carboxylesterase